MFLTDLLFPNRCLACSRIIPAAEVVCSGCFDQINFSHFDFSASNFLKEKCLLLFPVQHAFSLFVFEKESVSRQIIHHLKYSGRQFIGKKLAEWTAERLDLGHPRPDLIVCVPLHPRKQRQRGYNQLHLFAETLSAKTGIPFDRDALTRVHYQSAQAKKKKSGRLATHHVFSLEKNISGQHVLIIDDVFTTGNTMASVAWEFLKMPGNQVSVLVMAVDE